MDIYTVIWTFGTFRWSYYLITISTSLTFTIIYAVSNVIFLLALAVPLGKKIEHAYKKGCENLLIPLVTKHLLWYNLA